MSQSPGRDGPLLQLQRVDSSQAGARELSPVFSAPSPALPTLESHPICIPSPYTELGHDFGTLPLYGSSLAGYGGPPIDDCPPMRQSLSPTPFWTPPTHYGHVSPMAVHQPQSRLQHGQPNNGAWSEPAEENWKPVVGKRGLSEDRGVAGGKADLHFCAVCSDYASGYHYGVWSCEGCKAFFKRSIQGHNAYICPATNQCTIDKNRRKSCQACRLRKCYEMGMMKCGMRRDRSTYSRSSSGPQRRVSRVVPRASANTQRQGVEVAEEDRPLHQMATAAAAAATAAGHHRSDGSLTPEQLIACVLDAEPPEIYLMKDVKRPFTEAIIMMSLTNLADKELVHMISWAKKVPGFGDLGLLEQAHLLECCWLEVLMLGLMWRSVDQPGKLMFSPDLILTRDESSCVQGFMEIFDMLLSATARFRELRLQKEEYVCLKAMILLNSNMSLSTSEGGEGNEFQSRSKLLQLLDAVTDALVWAIAKGGGNFQQQSTRLAHLLMLLSHIRHLSNKGMDHLHSMKMKKMVPVYDLLLEMLDAHIMHSSRLAIPVA